MESRSEDSESGKKEAKSGTESIEAKSGTESIEAKSGTESIEAKSGTESIELMTGDKEEEGKTNVSPDSTVNVLEVNPRNLNCELFRLQYYE